LILAPEQIPKMREPQLPRHLPEPIHASPLARPPHQAAVCPDCGAGLVRQSACLVCVQCGWARCG